MTEDDDIPTLREMLVTWINQAISGFAELPDNAFAAVLSQVARVVPSRAVSQHLDKAANAALGADPFDLARELQETERCVARLIPDFVPSLEGAPPLVLAGTLSKN